MALVRDCEQKLAELISHTIDYASEQNDMHVGGLSFASDDHARSVGSTNISPPKSCAEAIKDPQWIASIAREWNGILAQGVLGSMEKIPEDEIGIPLRHQFTVKTNQNGEVVEHEGIKTGLKTRSQFSTCIIHRVPTTMPCSDHDAALAMP